MATQAFTFAVNASSTAVNITNNINTTIYAIAGGVDISVIPKVSSTDYDTIVINSIGIPPNILGQSLQIKTNFISTVGGVDVSEHTTTQILDAIMSLMASVATMSVTITGTPNINLTKVNGTTISLGQTTMAASLPVVIASDQSAIKTQNQIVDAVCEITRPANTTAYSANDAVSTGFVVTAATNATPIVITCGTHGLADGQPVLISGVVGNTAANAFSYAKVTGYSSTTFALYSDAALTTAVAGNGAWTSGGSVAAGFVFSGLPANCKGYITKIRVGTSDTGVTSVTPLVQLYTNAASPIADNAQFTLLYTNFSNRIGGVLTLPSFTTLGTGSTMYSTMQLLACEFTADANGRVYALLATNAAFTPSANSTQVSMALSFDINYIP